MQIQEMTLEGYVTITEAAAKVHCSRSYIVQKLNKGKLEGIKVHGLTMVSTASLNKEFNAEMDALIDLILADEK